MPPLDQVRVRLAAHDPKLIAPDGRAQAGVALVLRPSAPGFEVLLIERAHREGDPWSGHMAFPGGRVDRADRDAQAAAERETLEEVGVCLAGAERFGRLDDLQGRADRPLPLVISAFVYGVEDPGPLSTNEEEVAEALWVPAAHLIDPARHIEFTHPRASGSYPGVVVGHPERHVVWGLTYRFLCGFFELLGRGFPP